VERATLTELIVVLGGEQAGPELGEHVGAVLETVHELGIVLENDDGWVRTQTMTRRVRGEGFTRQRFIWKDWDLTTATASSRSFSCSSW